MRTVAHQLLLVSFFNAFLGWKVVMPAIAQSKSYRDFMAKVNEIVKPNDKLFLYGPFNSDSVVFYRGSVIEWLNQPAELVAWKDSSANGYLIMPVQSLTDFPRATGSLPPPLLESAGKGPEGDAPLVLVRAALR
jgi:hypothetical protein